MRGTKGLLRGAEDRVVVGVTIIRGIGVIRFVREEEKGGQRRVRHLLRLKGMVYDMVQGSYGCVCVCVCVRVPSISWALFIRSLRVITCSGSRVLLLLLLLLLLFSSTTLYKFTFIVDSSTPLRHLNASAATHFFTLINRIALITSAAPTHLDFPLKVGEFRQILLHN